MSECERTDELVVDHLDDALGEPERARLERHLAACDACREKVDAYRAIRGAYRTLPDHDVGERVAAAVLERARKELAPPGASDRRRVLAVTVLAAAALVVAWALGAIGTREPSAARRVDVLVREGDARRAAGELDAARAAYREAARLAGGGPRAAEVRHRLGEACAAIGDLPAALAEFDAVARDFPDYGERLAVLLARADVLARLGELDRAIHAYHDLAAEFPVERNEVARRVEELAGEVAGALQALGYVEGD